MYLLNNFLAPSLHSVLWFARTNGVPSVYGRLRGRSPANPLNLIRFVPAEGLDAVRLPALNP